MSDRRNAVPRVVRGALRSGLVLVVACGPSVDTQQSEGTGAVDGTSAGFSSGGGTVSASTTVAPGATSSDTGSVEGSSTGAVDTTGDASTGVDESASVCDPQPEDLGASLAFDADLPFVDEVDVDAVCGIVDVLDLGAGTIRYALECEDGEHTVDVWTSPPAALPLESGQSVRVRANRVVLVDLPGWEHVTIHDTDDVLVAGMFGDLRMSDGVDVASWFAPFTFTFDANVCEPEPYEGGVGDFISDPCPTQTERAAFMVASPWAMGFVYDRTSAPFGDYEVWIPWAKRLLPEGDPAKCDPVPVDVGRVVVLRRV